MHQFLKQTLNEVWNIKNRQRQFDEEKASSVDAVLIKF